MITATVGMGCGDVTKESPDPVGALGVSIANLGMPGVTSIVLTATGPGAGGTAGFTHTMTANTRDEWTYVRSNLEPGTYYVEATALDASDAVLYETGLVEAVVPAGNSAHVTLILHPSVPVDGVTNHAPRFLSIVADSTSVQPNQEIELTFGVADLEGDGMSLSGAAECATPPCADVGSLAVNPLEFTDPTPDATQTGSMTWTAPGTSGLYTLRFVLTDARSAATDFTMQLAVGDPTGGLSVDFRINMAPVVSQIAVAPSGTDAVDLVATVSDDHTDPSALLFAWTADPLTCTGTFDAQAAETTFTLTAFDPNSEVCALTLTVTDEDEGVSISQIFLNKDLVDLKYRPALRAIFQTQIDAVAGDVIEFGVEAELFGGDLGVDPTFVWTHPGTLTTATDTNTGVASELSWTAAAGELQCVAGTATFSVIATGGDSGLTSDPVLFVVAVDPTLCLP